MIVCRPAIAGYVYCYYLPSVYFVLDENTFSGSGGSASVTILKTSPYNIHKLDKQQSGVITVIYRSTNSNIKTIFFVAMQ